MKCKSKTGNKDEIKELTKSGKPILKSKCVVCGTRKNRFMKHEVPASAVSSAKPTEKEITSKQRAAELAKYLESNKDLFDGDLESVVTALKIK